MPDVSFLEFGLTGFLLLLVWKVLEIGKQLFLNHKQQKSNSPMACQIDPQHYQHIKDIHTYTMETARKIDQGAFACQWKDRDEIRDLMSILQELTRETRVLASELRKTRNGHNDH